MKELLIAPFQLQASVFKAIAGFLGIIALAVVHLVLANMLVRYTGTSFSWAYNAGGMTIPLDMLFKGYVVIGTFAAAYSK